MPSFPYLSTKKPLDPQIESFCLLINEMSNVDIVSVTDVELYDFENKILNLDEPMSSAAHQLYAKLIQDRELTKVYHEIARGVYFEEVLSHVYDSFNSLISYSRIGCAILEKNDEVARARWVRSTTQSFHLKVGYSSQITNSSLQDILDTGKPRIINNLPEYYKEHPTSKSTKLILKEGVNSSLTCPLIANDLPIGFLFFSSNEVGCYEKVHKDIFLHLSGLVSIAVEKSLLYEKLANMNGELLKARPLLKYQATHDGLTGLLNRSTIEKHLSNTVSRLATHRTVKSVSLGILMLDIDHFKYVNVVHGHQVGDKVLAEISSILAEEIRSNGQIGRYGGEEFLIISDNTDEKEVFQLAERLRTTVAESDILTDAGNVHIIISIGTATAQYGDNSSYEAILRRADVALYESFNS